MTENLYASPEPVEEFVLDEKWRPHVRALRITAAGLVVTAVGFLLVMLILFVEALWVFAHIPAFALWEEVQWPVGIAAFAALVLGPLMCLACGDYLVRYGRWMALGLPLFFIVPYVVGFILHPNDDRFSFVLITAIYAGHLLWGLFLLRLARSLKVRRYSIMTWFAMLFWTVTWLLFAVNMLSSGWRRYLDSRLPLDSEYISMLTYLAGVTVCGCATLIFSCILFRRLWTPQKTENENE